MKQKISKSVMKQYVIEWCNPLALARAIAQQEQDMICYYSSLHVGFSGQNSIIAYKPQDKVVGSNIDIMQPVVTADKMSYDNAWFGYMGYELVHGLEHVPATRKAPINMPPLWMTRYGIVIVHDMEKRTCNVWLANGYTVEDIPVPATALAQKAPVKVKSVESNMTKQQYMAYVDTILEAIYRGDLYQSNLTRKFYGELEQEVDSFELFAQLCQQSPAPYSAFIKHDDTHIISSSPEQFMHVNRQGKITVRPIKGSAARHANSAEDEQSKHALAESEKDKSENLMIVDLMRNDLSRSCEPGSVKVESLFDITTYKTVHHMSSTITGQQCKDKSLLEVIKGSFPPGSMTGAPKVKAMEVAATLEQYQRGVYSGILGVLYGDGAADFSVVIRTLLMQKKKFEFQVGGAIVADSTPQGEWQETLVKAKAIAHTLGLDPEIDLAF